MAPATSDPNAYVYYDASLCSYDAPPPYHPASGYPEYRFGAEATVASNPVYDAVREYFRGLRWDDDHYGEAGWNPLKELVSPGQTVLVKPNWVKHENPLDHTTDGLITHASILRPVIDYLLIALGGTGRIILGDAPIQSCDFERLCRENGVLELIAFYRQVATVPVELADFRKERAVMSLSTVVERQSIQGDPYGYAAVQVGERSALAPVSERSPHFRVSNYDPAQMAAHHRGTHHEYLISGSVLKADVVFFVAKMKTHRKAGMTAALKNSVGINGSKDWLPHHSRGAKAGGGDAYLHRSILKAGADTFEERIERTSSKMLKRTNMFVARAFHRLAKMFARDRYFEGSWYGNDTVWRMVLDLNRVVLYADREGVLQPTVQRRAYFLVDGIVGAEGEGPIAVTPKPCGVLVGGESAPVVDATVASLMGFDYRKIPLIRESFLIQDPALVDFSVDDVRVHSNSEIFEDMDLLAPSRHFAFVPSSGWQGHVELGQVDPNRYARRTVSGDAQTRTY